MKQRYPLSTRILIAALIFGNVFFSGCSGIKGSEDSASGVGGGYSLQIIWPGAYSNKDNNVVLTDRYLPFAAQTITVSVTGAGLTSALSTSITKAETATTATVTFDNLPAGPKVALIKAFDSGSKLLVQRKDSFIVYNGRTSASSNIPLGVAVRIIGSDIVFEPTSVTVNSGADVPFQNWADLNLTVTGVGADLFLPGAYQDGTGRWIFSDGNKKITDSTNVGIYGKNAWCNLTAVWQNNFGGSNSDSAYSVTLTPDGGYAMAGCTESSGSFEVTGTNRGGYDYWIVKLNSTGGIVWQKNYGGSSDDYAWSITHTPDGGYIAAGYTNSSESYEVTGTNRGGWDCWIVKLNSTGGITWQKNYGGTGNDRAWAIINTSDGGYAVAAHSSSSESYDVTGKRRGGWDYWIIKLDSTGGITWQKTYGGTATDYALSIAQASDGGYAIAGYSTSPVGYEITEPVRGNADYWILKLNSTGEIIWNKNYGGAGSDQARYIIQTSDGGFVVAGYTSSSESYEVTGTNRGGYDYWIVKHNSTGGIVWQKNYGGTGEDYAYSVVQTPEGGYVAVGHTSSSESFEVSGKIRGGYDFWTVKLDSTGGLLWQKNYGGSNDDKAYSLVQTTDGGYAAVGFAASSETGEVKGTGRGGNDYWIVKMDANGLLE